MENRKVKMVSWIHHVKKHKGIYLFVVVMGIVLYALPMRGIFANMVLQFQLWKMDVEAHYQVQEIRYTKQADNSHEAYTMKLVGQGEDDIFYITYDDSGVYTTYDELIVRKENTIRRMTTLYEEEVMKRISYVLSTEESVVFDFGGQAGQVWMRDHFTSNMMYHKDAFQDLTQHIGIHFRNRKGYDDIVQTMMNIQQVLDREGYVLSIYNITIENDQNRATFSNFTREDITSSLITRLEKIANGETDTNIVYQMQ